jgi:putative transposase
LANILYGLRAYLLPERFTIPQLGKMSLKFGAIEMLFEHPIVALMERYAMVVDHPSDIDDALEIPIPLMVVELKLQGFHTSDDSTIRSVSQNHRHKITSVTLINYHFVWITRRRRKVLIGEVESRLKQRINEVATELDCGVIAMEIMPEHVHLFLNCPPMLAPDQIMFRIKARTAKVLREEFEHLQRMPSMWTRSYFCSTAGNVSSATIQRYIAEQKSK